MNKRPARLPRVIVLAVCLAGVLAAADARAILNEVRTRATFRTLEYAGMLKVFGKDGAPLERQWVFRGTGQSGRRKTVIRFVNPPEIRGVAVLILNQPSGAAAQWMWIPAIGRDRRIAPQDRSTSVFGTDFTFEDLEDRNLDQYEVRLLPEAMLGGAQCHRIECRVRQRRDSQYDSVVLTVDQEWLVVRQADSYRGQRLVRRVDFTDFRTVQGIRTAYKTEVGSLETGSRTVLTLDRVRYNLPLADSAFTREALRLPQ